MDRSDYFRVSKPARYVGGEYGAVKPKGNAAMKMCLCFPDVYEVGMSNLGTRILYYMLTRTLRLHANVVMLRGMIWAVF